MDTRTSQLPKAEQSTEQAKCVHHWLIAPPAGTESLGECIRCGAKRRFANLSEGVEWERSDIPRVPSAALPHLAEDNAVLAEEA